MFSAELGPISQEHQYAAAFMGASNASMDPGRDGTSGGARIPDVPMGQGQAGGESIPPILDWFKSDPPSSDWNQIKPADQAAFDKAVREGMAKGAVYVAPKAPAPSSNWGADFFNAIAPVIGTTAVTLTTPKQQGARPMTQAQLNQMRLMQAQQNQIPWTKVLIGGAIIAAVGTALYIATKK